MPRHWHCLLTDRVHAAFMGKTLYSTSVAIAPRIDEAPLWRTVNGSHCIIRYDAGVRATSQSRQGPTFTLRTGIRVD